MDESYFSDLEEKENWKQSQGRLITVPLVPHFGSPGTQESKCIKFLLLRIMATLWHGLE